MRAEQTGQAEEDIEQMNYIWMMIKGLIEDLTPWIYAVLIMVVTLLILSTAIGIQP